MTHTIPFPAKQWTVQQALILAALCVSVGIAGGWFIRGWQAPSRPGSAQTVATSEQPKNVAVAAPQPPTPAQLKSMADAQATPLLDRLKSEPANPYLLAGIGNIYYDAQQYPVAVDYYGRVLKSAPSNAAVRTDMATAYWYMGNADTAIAEFNEALTYAPTNPNTLFNLGLVKLQGKKDRAGAIADWNKLLVANPTYEGKDKVKQMMAEATMQATANQGNKPK
jgi:tetratricopeptide (TPR) repeat protein